LDGFLEVSSSISEGSDSLSSIIDFGLSVVNSSLVTGLLGFTLRHFGGVGFISIVLLSS